MKKYLNLLIAILFTLSLNAGGGKAKIVFDSFLRCVHLKHAQSSLHCL